MIGRRTSLAFLFVCIAAGQLIHETHAAPALSTKSSDAIGDANEVETRLDALQQQLTEIRASQALTDSVIVVGNEAGTEGGDTDLAERVEEQEKSAFPSFYASDNKASQSVGIPIARPPPRRRQFRRHLAWQPMRRMVSWQPMKRAQNVEYSREQVIRAIEAQLKEVLSAGERLGITSDDIVKHLQERGSTPSGGGYFY